MLLRKLVEIQSGKRVSKKLFLDIQKHTIK